MLYFLLAFNMVRGPPWLAPYFAVDRASAIFMANCATTKHLIGTNKMPFHRRFDGWMSLNVHPTDVSISLADHSQSQAQQSNGFTSFSWQRIGHSAKRNAGKCPKKQWKRLPARLPTDTSVGRAKWCELRTLNSVSFARVDRLDANTSVLLVGSDVCSQLIMPLIGQRAGEDKRASTRVNVCQTQTAQRKLLSKVQKTKKKVIYFSVFCSSRPLHQQRFPLHNLFNFRFRVTVLGFAADLIHSPLLGNHLFLLLFQ